MDEITGPGTVTDIKAKVNKKKSDKPANTYQIESAKKKDVHALIVGAMIGTSQTRWPAFPAKLHRCVDHKGQSLVYEESAAGIVRPVADGHVDHLIATYWETLDRGEVSLGTLTADDIAKTRRLWYGRAPGLTEPFPVLTWRSDPRPAHHKMAFDPYPWVAPTPRFDELMARTTNSAALRAWIGSLFDEKSQRHQYVWIYGDGGNGKGTLVRCLDDALGSAVRSEQVPGKDSRFWAMGLLGARLITFSDCDEPEFVRTGRFKSLSGEDRTRVEIKSGAILSMKLPVKFLFTSNEKPEISGGKSDTRRIIYCAMTAPDCESADFEAAMLSETQGFLSNCWRHYLEVSAGNPRHVIEHDNGSEINDLVSTTEHELEAFVDGYLAFDRDEAGRLAPDLDGKKIITHGSQMKAVMIAAGFRSERERNRLRIYIERRHGIVSKVITPTGGKSFRGFEYVDIQVGL